MSEAIVIGGGAAGMFSAICLAENGWRVTLFEKNEKLGKKLFITGKGRCNLTNDCTDDEFFSHVVTNSRFLYSAYHQCPSGEVCRLFESWGLTLKTERGRRVFPASDHAYDVIDVLKRRLIRCGVRIELNTRVDKLMTETTEEGLAMVTGVFAGGETFPADRVVIATGGLSYPSTGSTGDGLRFAADTGHRITACRPSLVAINCAEADAAALSRLTLKNIRLTVRDSKKTLYDDFGELTFMPYGISGPLVLTASALAGDRLRRGNLTAEIDLKPAVDEVRLDRDIIRLLTDNANKDVIHAVRGLYPAVMVPVLLDRAGIDPRSKARDLTKSARRRLLLETKHFRLTLTSLRGYEEAVITRGGVSVSDIEPATMMSKKVQGLAFAGEVIDVDALTGGFNLQIAWATAYAAGTH